MATPNYRKLDYLVRNTVGLNAYPIQGVEGLAASWANPGQGRVGIGNNNPFDPATVDRIVPWAVVFRNRDNAPGPDTWCEAGNLALKTLPSGTGVWGDFTSYVRPDGQLYWADFEGPNDGAIGPATIHSVAPDLLVASPPGEDECWHLYGVRTLTPLLSGLVVTIDARLVSASGGDLSPEEDGSLLMQVGCDWKNPDGSIILDAFVSRAEPITSRMKRFGATTMTLAQLLANPPDVSGLD